MLVSANFLILPVTPSPFAYNALHEFDSLFFSNCTGVDTPDHAWHHAQLSLRRAPFICTSFTGAYITYLSNSNCATSSAHRHLAYVIAQLNTIVVLSLLMILWIVPFLRDRLEDLQFNNLFDAASSAHVPQSLSTLSPHASAWLMVVPSDGLCPPAITSVSDCYQMVDTRHNYQVCPLSPGKALDKLDHHCTTCKCEGDVTNRHNLIVQCILPCILISSP